MLWAEIGSAMAIDSRINAVLQGACSISTPSGKKKE